MSASEGTPLLADPPIDDDSYRHEARAFPSDEQKQLLFMSYAFTNVLSRIFEGSTTLLIVLTFRSNLVAVTLYSLALFGFGVRTENVMHTIARQFKSRLLLVSLSIIMQRLSAIVFLYLIICFNQPDSCFSTNGPWYIRAPTFAVMVFSVVWLKASQYLYQRSFRTDWLMALASTQENIRFQFDKTMHGFSVVVQLLTPILIGAFLTSFSVIEVAKLYIYVSVCGILIEPSLIYKLFQTCYALYLPRNRLTLDFADYAGASELRTIIGMWQSGPSTARATTSAANAAAPSMLSIRTLRQYSPVSARPLSRIYKYVKRKPLPVAVTFGTLLITSASLVAIAPSTGWFFYAQGMSPLAIGLLRSAQLLITLHPAIPARLSFALAGGGTLACLPFLYVATHWEFHRLVWTYLFAFCILVARAGSPTISLVGEEFVKEYLADEEVLKVFKENAVWLRMNCELGVQFLTLIWPQQQQFFWPVSVSAFLTFGGIFMVLTLIRRYWASINSQ